MFLLGPCSQKDCQSHRFALKTYPWITSSSGSEGIGEVDEGQDSDCYRSSLINHRPALRGCFFLKLLTVSQCATVVIDICHHLSHLLSDECRFDPGHGGSALDWGIGGHFSCQAGKIIEQGKHNELLKKSGGKYANLVQQQLAVEDKKEDTSTDPKAKQNSSCGVRTKNRFEVMDSKGDRLSDIKFLVCFTVKTLLFSLF